MTKGDTHEAQRLEALKNKYNYGRKAIEGAAFDILNSDPKNNNQGKQAVVQE